MKRFYVFRESDGCLVGVVTAFTEAFACVTTARKEGCDWLDLFASSNVFALRRCYERA